MQRFINWAAFLEPVSDGFLCSFWTGQIDKMKVSTFHAFYTVVHAGGINLHGENRMRSGACFIITGRPHMSSFWSFPENFQCIITLVDELLSDSFNIYSLFQILSDIESAVLPKQIDDLFIIDFDERALDHILHTFLANLSFNRFKQMLESSRDKPSELMVLSAFRVDSHHGESFACSCLPIGEDRTIITYIMIGVYLPCKSLCSSARLFKTYVVAWFDHRLNQNRSLLCLFQHS